MKRALIIMMVLAGCHKSTSNPAEDAAVTDAGGGGDATVDAWQPPACANPVAGTKVATRLVGKADDAAMLATSPPGDDRLFIVDKSGVIQIFDHEVKNAKPFIDLSVDGTGRVLATGGEQGLLGLAFHPSFATNGQFYVFFTALNPNSSSDPHNVYVDVVERYTVSATDPNVADPASATLVLSIPDFAANHNGGMMEFGADGFLYIGTGDGGGGGDPDRNGQNPDALLAKFLRIDVDHPANGKPYGIPAGNPFATSGGAPEVWILGVRNPWRWSFDRVTGDLWIGDVGQGVTEEIDMLKAGEQAGKNLGWSVYEGTTCCTDQGDHCTQSPPYQTCDHTGKTDPLDMRLHSATWDAIIGGQVYRGSCFPDLVGWYFYTDNVKHGLSRARLKPDGSLEIVDLPAPTAGWPQSPASIHADARGALFETTTDGSIYAIEATP